MPTREGWLLAKRAELVGIEADIQSMIALNTWRANRGEQIGYDENAFYQKAEEARTISELIMRED